MLWRWVNSFWINDNIAEAWKKMRCKFFIDSIRQYSAPGSDYFHLACNPPFYQPFECISHRLMFFKSAELVIHREVLYQLLLLNKTWMWDLNINTFWKNVCKTLSGMIEDWYIYNKIRSWHAVFWKFSF